MTHQIIFFGNEHFKNVQNMSLVLISCFSKKIGIHTLYLNSNISYIMPALN